MITISAKRTRFTFRDGVVFASLENNVVWLPGQRQRTIIAVGSPGEWHSRQPLRSDAVQTDLVGASLDEPGLANQLWGSFISHIVLTAKLSFAKSLKYAFLAHYLGVDIRIGIDDPRARAAVHKALEGTPAKFRLKVVAADDH